MSNSSSAVAEPRLNGHEVKTRANGHWRDILSSLAIHVSSSPRQHGPCPTCGGKDRFRFDDQDGNGGWFCNQCQPKAGDGFRLVMNARHCAYSEALQLVADALGGQPSGHIQHDHETAAAEMAAHTLRSAESSRIREEEEAKKHAEAAKWAQVQWDQAAPAPAEHPYLTKKQVQPHGLRVDNENRLIVPVMIGGALASLQFIDADSKKKLFLAGGKTKGGRYTLGSLSDGGTIILCEGFATGASLYEAIGLPVVVAFSAGNLRHVAEQLRQQFQTAMILVCGDNDTSGTGQRAALEAAATVGGVVALPEEQGQDWNDIHTQRGLDVVKEKIESVIRLEEPTLIPLDEVVLCELPMEAFPDSLGNMIAAVAQATETPVELAAMMGLATVATCCQKFFLVEGAPGYTEPLCLWTVAALESGNRKTAVHQRMTAPLVDRERDLRTQGEPERAAKESARLTVEAQVKALRAKVATSEDIEDIEGNKEKLSRLEATMPPMPTIPQLWAQDVTPERLAVLMAENGEAMALLSDEGGLFDMMAGRYSKGVPNLDLYLQGHARAPVRVDRGSRPQVDLAAPTLTIGISPQPSVLRGLTHTAGFRERGLLARFLYALPESRLGYRVLKTMPVPEAVASRYGAMIKALLAIDPTKDESGRTVPMTLRLSTDAQREWQEFALVVETSLRPGGEYEYLKDWAGKLPGAALRVAGIFHCVTHAHGTPQSREISLATLTQALGLLAVLGKHTIAVFDLMQADPALEGARKVMQWVQRERKESFTARDCYQAVRGSLKSMAVLEPSLKLLCERGQLVLIPPAHIGKGRPLSPTYTVHLDLRKGWR